MTYNKGDYVYTTLQMNYNYKFNFEMIIFFQKIYDYPINKKLKYFLILINNYFLRTK